MNNAQKQILKSLNEGNNNLRESSFLPNLFREISKESKFERNNVQKKGSWKEIEEKFKRKKEKLTEILKKEILKRNWQRKKLTERKKKEIDKEILTEKETDRNWQK